MSEQQDPYTPEPLGPASRLLWVWRESGHESTLRRERLPVVFTDRGRIDGRFQTIVRCAAVWPEEQTISTAAYESRLWSEMKWLERAGFDVNAGVGMVKDGVERTIWPPAYPGTPQQEPVLLKTVSRLRLAAGDTLVLHLATALDDAGAQPVLDYLQAIVPPGVHTLLLNPDEDMTHLMPAEPPRLDVAEKRLGILLNALQTVMGPDQWAQLWQDFAAADEPQPPQPG